MANTGTKKKDGKELESFVRTFESIGLPPGFRTEVRQKVYNDDGVQIAECDIVISGPIGTSEWKMLIECRDRPSEGAAPVGWIEQLAGRKRRLKFDKVMAVSTTGFSPGAIEYAGDEDIILRQLNEVSLEDLGNAIPLNAPLVIQTVGLTGMQIGLNTESPQDAERFQQVVQKVDDTFRNTETGESFSIKDIERDFTKKIDVAEHCSVGQTVEYTHTIAPELCDKLQALKDGHWFQVVSLSLNFSLSSHVPNMPLVQSIEYKSDGEDVTRFCEAYRYRAGEDPKSPEVMVVLVPRQE